jgi:hypothetical protein
VQQRRLPDKDVVKDAFCLVTKIFINNAEVLENPSSQRPHFTGEQDVISYQFCVPHVDGGANHTVRRTFISSLRQYNFPLYTFRQGVAKV